MIGSRLHVGEDGRPRCWWCGDDPLYVAYHDDEWGRPVHDERALFELLCLEAAQAGLAWITVLRKRDGYREAFAGFDIEGVAAMGPSDVERLLGDPGIIRNRAKVGAMIGNARATLALGDEGTSLAELVWSFAPPPRSRPLAPGDLVPATTAESEALSRTMRQRGFRFVGPTIAYAYMQSAGVVDDHLAGCWRASTAG